MNDIKKIQQQYDSLMLKEKLTKKDICDLLIPFRDKYGLTDLETLKIARKQLTQTQIQRLILTRTLENKDNTPVYSINCRNIVIHLRWYNDINDKVKILMTAVKYSNKPDSIRTEHISLAQLKKGYSALKWLNDFSEYKDFEREEFKLIKDIILNDVITSEEYHIKIGG